MICFDVSFKEGQTVPAITTLITFKLVIARLLGLQRTIVHPALGNLAGVNILHLDYFSQPLPLSTFKLIPVP